MRIAALYDIHGNLPALEAVLAEPDVAAADVVVVGGDAIAGPMPAETLRLLAAQGERIVWLAGNNEREMFERREADPDSGGLWDRRAVWVAGRLTASERASVADWPGTVVIDVDGLGPVLFCHATPRSDSEIFTAITPPAVVEPMLAGVAEATVVCGHTHVQFDRRDRRPPDRERRQRRHALRGSARGALVPARAGCRAAHARPTTARPRRSGSGRPSCRSRRSSRRSHAAAHGAGGDPGVRGARRGRGVTGADGRPHCHFVALPPAASTVRIPCRFGSRCARPRCLPSEARCAMVSIAGGSTRGIHTRSSYPGVDAAC